MMYSEVWWRNPGNYINELIECQERNIIWDYGYLAKRKQNPHPWMSAYFGNSLYRAIICGTQGSPEFMPHTSDPVAVYPTWEYSDDITKLEEWAAFNVGDNEELCNDESLPEAQRYVFGQEHRVIVTNMPNTSERTGKQFLRVLQDIQGENPKCIIHVHGLYTMSTPVRMGFRAFDFEPRTMAAKGVYYNHVGKKITNRSPVVAQEQAGSLDLLGFLPVDTQDGRKRCMINIRAARYVGDHFHDDDNLLMRRSEGAEIDITSPAEDFKPVTAKSPLIGKPIFKQGDKVTCDTCSLANSCRQYREGSVCSLPGSEGRRIAQLFDGSRDVSKILDGYAGLIHQTAERFDQGREDEILEGELNSEVTKVGSALGIMIEKFAKLVDPSLAKPGVVIGRIGGNDTHEHLTLNGREVKSIDDLLKVSIEQLMSENNGAMDGITESMVQDRMRKLATPALAAQLPASPAAPAPMMPFPASKIVDA